VILKPDSSRILAGTLFTIGAGCLALLPLLGAPSFWYFPCGYALVPLCLVWWRRPSLAAALSVGPLVASAVLVRDSSGAWLATWAAFLLAAVIPVLIELRKGQGWKLPLILSLSFLLASFCTDRLFTNKASIKTFQMDVALDGHAPWGDVGPEWEGGPAPLVLYRRVGTSYCYEAFKSQELRDRLAQEHRNSVTVEYNLFSDFGRERSYNVRSVDGVVLTNGQRVVKDVWQFGGQVLADGAPAPSCW